MFCRIFLLLLLTNTTSSQSVKASITVDSMYVYQIDNQNDKEIYLVISGLVLPYWCYLSNASLTNHNDTINVELCYNYPGIGARPCLSFDTLYLGNYPSGDYAIEVDINAVRIEDSTCANPTRQDTFHLNFSVVTGLSEVWGNDNNWRVFPNPAIHLLTIQTQSSITTTLQITTTDGRVVLEQSAAMQNKWEVDVSSLPKGLYFAVLQTEQGRAVKRWVKE